MKKIKAKKAEISAEGQSVVNQLIAQLKETDRTNLDVQGLIAVLAENNAISGNTAKTLQESLSRLGKVQPVINIEAPPEQRKPWKWSIKVNRDQRGEAQDYDLIPHFETVN